MIIPGNKPDRFEILAIMGNDGTNALQLIERAGRTAYQSQDKISSGTAERFVKMLRERGHESVLEHSAMTVRFFNCSRGFTHELVRHRLMAITQQSTRYVNEESFDFVMPPGYGPDNDPLIWIKEGKDPIGLLDYLELARKVYVGLREQGWKNEDARQFLPIGITSEIVVTTNLREWRHIFSMRTAKAAHWEIRSVMCGLLAEVKKQIPVIFDDFIRIVASGGEYYERGKAA